MSRLTLYDFTADWCGTCKPVERMIDREIKPKYSDRIDILRVDVHKGIDLVKKFNVLSVPTVILCNQTGDVLLRKSGEIRLKELEEAILTYK